MVALPIATFVADPDFLEPPRPEDSTVGLVRVEVPPPPGENWPWDLLGELVVAVAATCVIVALGHALSGPRGGKRLAVFWLIVGVYLVSAAWNPLAGLSAEWAPRWTGTLHGWAVFVAVWTLVTTLSFNSVPARLHEMAAVDGAGLWSGFWATVWPYQRLVIALVLVAALAAALSVRLSWTFSLLINLLAMSGAFLLISRPRVDAMDDVRLG